MDGLWGKTKRPICLRAFSHSIFLFFQFRQVKPFSVWYQLLCLKSPPVWHLSVIFTRNPALKSTLCNNCLVKTFKRTRNWVLERTVLFNDFLFHSPASSVWTNKKIAMMPNLPATRVSRRIVTSHDQKWRLTMLKVLLWSINFTVFKKCRCARMDFERSESDS